MKQVLFIPILIALISAGNIGINRVKADGFGSFGPGGWHCDSNGYKVCESYNQKPTIQTVDWHCIWQKDSNGYDVCISAIQHPIIKQVDGPSWACHGDPNSGPYSCDKIWPFSSSSSIGQFQQVSINCVKNDDGSWTCTPDNDAFTQPQPQQHIRAVDCGSQAISCCASGMHWNNDKGQCTDDGYIQQSQQHQQIQAVDCSNCAGNSDCNNGQTCSFSEQLPTVQTVTAFGASRSV